MKPEQRPVLSTRTIKDRQYVVQRHEFALFCQQSGEIRVPEIQVRCSSIKSVGDPPAPHVLRVPAFKVAPRLPAEARAGQVLVTTTRLEVRETWNPPPGDAKVGDAFRHTVTLRAVDVPGMLLPQIPKLQPEGLSVYSSGPGIDDRTERGQFTGQRIESISYICESAGKIEIPGVRIRWWNPTKPAWEEKTLPAVTLTISPNPAYVSKESDDLTPAGQTSQAAHLWSILVIGLIALGFFLVSRRRKSDKEAQAFREVIQACRDNDAGSVYNAVTRWRSLDVGFTGAPPMDVTEELVSAQRVILGLEPLWEGRDLEKSMQSWRRQVRHGKSLLQAGGNLPDLNPGG
jgi:hypothetical protein